MRMKYSQGYFHWEILDYTQNDELLILKNGDIAQASPVNFQSLLYADSEQEDS